MIIHQRDNSLGNYNYNSVIYKKLNWRPHFHKNFELIYVISGEVDCTVNGKNRIMTAGDFGMCLSNEVHSLYSLGDVQCWIGVFSGDFVHSFEKQVKNKTGDDFVFRCSESIKGFLRDNLIKWEVPDTYLLKSCLYAACGEYCRSVNLTEQTAKSDLLMRAMTDYISENFKNKISLSDMAERLGYNYHYLSKTFHKVFDMSFPEFLNSYRIDYAMQLLTETEKDIAEIAFESGFQSIRSFNNFFKTYIGKTPMQYRSTRN